MAMNILERFFDLGTSPENDLKRNQSIRLINKICLFVILIITPHMLLTAYYHSTLATFMQLGSITALGLTVYINSRRLFNIARPMSLLVGNLHILVMSFVLGYESGTYFYFSAAIIAPLFFYTTNEMKSIVFFPLLTTALALLVQFVAPGVEPIAYIPDILKTSFFYFSVFGSLGIIFIFVLHFYNESNQSEQSLKAINRKLLELSETDPLTQLPNRRSFNRHLDREWAKGVLSKTLLAVIIIDLDHFKKYNESYGRQEADRKLASVARLISQNTRQFLDFPARYAGGEFIVLLSNIDMDSIQSSAERIRMALLESAIPHKLNTDTGLLTCSLGVACCVPDNDLDAENLIDEAEKALLKAKENGRNKMELSFINNLNVTN